MMPTRSVELETSMQGCTVTGAGHHEVKQPLTVTRAKTTYVLINDPKPVRRKKMVTVRRPVEVKRMITVRKPETTARDVVVSLPEIDTTTRTVWVPRVEKYTVRYQELVQIIRMGAAEEVAKYNWATPAASMRRSVLDSEFDNQNLDSSVLWPGNAAVDECSRAAGAECSADEFDAAMEVVNRQRDWASIPVGAIWEELVWRTRELSRPVQRQEVVEVEWTVMVPTPVQLMGYTMVEHQVEVGEIEIQDVEEEVWETVMEDNWVKVPITSLQKEQEDWPPLRQNQEASTSEGHATPAAPHP